MLQEGDFSKENCKGFNDSQYKTRSPKSKTFDIVRDAKVRVDKEKLNEAWSQIEGYIFEQSKLKLKKFSKNHLKKNYIHIHEVRFKCFTKS